MKKFICLLILLFTYFLPIHSYAQEENKLEGEWINRPVNQYGVETAKIMTSVAVLSDTSLEGLITQLENALLQRKTAFTIDYYGDISNLEEKVDQAIKTVLSNNEYLSYDFQGLKYSGSGTNAKFTLSFTVDYYQTADQVHYVDNRIQKILTEMIIKPDMNTHEKVKAVHDYVVLNVQYDTTLNQNVNAPYFALTQGKTLCNGYAMLMYLMLKELDIPVRLISGTADGIGHAWNLVQLDGKWYHLDATWDDPVPDKQGRTLYNYYLVSDNLIDNNHLWQQGGLNGYEQSYPAADTDYAETLSNLGYSDLVKRLNLQYLNPEFTSYTDNQFISLVSDHFNKMEDEFSIRFLTNDVNIREKLNDLTQAAAEQTDTNSWIYSWQEYTRTEESDYIVMISNIEYSTSKEMVYPISGYKSFGEKRNVDSQKDWTVKFSVDLDRNLTNQNVYVLDRFGKKEINVITQMDNRTIKVEPPTGGYKLGETYYLVIENSIRSTNGKNLKEAVTYKFTITA